MSRRSRGRLCPACAKPFKNEKTLLQHLNQPRGRCVLLEHVETLTSDSATISAPNDDPPFDEDPYDDTDMAGPTDHRTHAPNVRDQEFFPGAGRIYGEGPTFMAQFDADKHASKREKNTYYPFHEQGDWELGSWLLRSGLSMRAIDDFLRLRKVRSFPICRDTYVPNVW